MFLFYLVNLVHVVRVLLFWSGRKYGNTQGKLGPGPGPNYTCMSITYTESMYFLPDQYPRPCMPSGLQFVIEIATSCIVKHKLLETFHTEFVVCSVCTAQVTKAV